MELGDLVEFQGQIGLVYEVREDKVQVLECAESGPGVEITGEDVDSNLGTPLFVTTKMLLVDKGGVRRIGRLSSRKIDEVLRQLAYDVVDKHYAAVHSGEGFVPGETYIRYAGRVYDEEEMRALADATLDHWLTSGRFAQQFCDELSEFLGVKHCLLTNSGSSANLLAVCALTSPRLEDRRLKEGDEVITPACTFPTTVNPIVQNNLVPVFVDVDVGTYNLQVDKIEDALSPRTRAILLPHTLGNPFDLDKVLHICKKHDLWLIEDNCDALGSTYNGKYTGTLGDIGTISFFPAHHITMGEGGALITNDTQLKRAIVSFRDWGRDCWCDPGHDNTCGKRFEWQLGSLPYGYDHKFIYSHIGYNLKVTDMQAAVGVAQMKKLPQFIEARKENWKKLYDGLKDYEDYFVLPRTEEGSDPSWFGFVLTVREDAPFSRNEITSYLEENKIATRLVFSGNIIRHPSFEGVRYRIFDDLANTDFIMNNSFWIGVYPGLTDEMIDYVLGTFKEFMESNR